MGVGLAGACAAAVLRRDRKVTIVDAGVPAGKASGASAGLVNPFPGLRAAPAWRHDEALEALDELIDRAGITPARERGLLRPAQDPDQAEHFESRSAEHAGELAWLPDTDMGQRWPAVRAPFGALWVPGGGAIDTVELIHGLIDGLPMREHTLVTSFGEEASHAWIDTAAGERLEAGIVILAPGDGFWRLHALRHLPLGRLKGQTVRVRWPDGSPTVPPMAGSGYVVPSGETLVLGSTHERAFTHGEPSREATRTVLEKASRLVRGLDEAEVVDSRAGIRVTVPASISRRRLPRVGPLPGHRRVWLFIGLGSKGLMTAPLLARRLPAWLNRPETIPGEVNTENLAA